MHFGRGELPPAKVVLDRVECFEFAVSHSVLPF